METYLFFVVLFDKKTKDVINVRSVQKSTHDKVKMKFNDWIAWQLNKFKGYMVINQNLI